jgi:hypothetical protein
MILLRTLVIICLLAAGFAFLPDQPHASAACIDDSGNGDIDVWYGPRYFAAGATITATMTTDPGAGTALGVFVDGALVYSSVIFTTPHQVLYVFPASVKKVEVVLDWQYNGLASNTYTITFSNCGMLPSETVPEPEPGCDVLIDIPSDAVGATLTADTPVFWAPGEASTETFPAGLSVRALGVDASGAYTKVVYACGYYWVPSSAIGPNYDAVWNGASLPTGVVE